MDATAIATVTIDRTNGSRTIEQRRRRDLRLSRALLWPALGVAILITQVPFVITIVLSFRRWNLLQPMEQGWVGFGNYAAVFHDSNFYQALLSTVIITGSSVVLSVVFGLGLAVLLNRKFRGRVAARTLLITPFLIMPAAAALLWKWSFFDAGAGLLNWVITTLGGNAVAWNTDFPQLTIIIVLTWQYAPFMMLIMLAGLQSQDTNVLEAASVDGAGSFRSFTNMTLPHLRQYVELASLLGSILLLQVFDPVAIMTGGAGGTTTLPYLLYERAFIGLDIGQASAYGVIAVIITIVVATLALRLLFRIFSTQGSR